MQLFILPRDWLLFVIYRNIIFGQIRLATKVTLLEDLLWDYQFSRIGMRINGHCRKKVCRGAELLIPCGYCSSNSAGLINYPSNTCIQFVTFCMMRFLDLSCFCVVMGTHITVVIHYFSKITHSTYVWI